jgi:thiamine pyrophosphokinase
MRTVIFANGHPPDRLSAARWLSDAELIIAADGGARHALALGIWPHVVIGDLDSLAEADRQRLKHAGARFIIYSPRKDYTDLELALRHALDRGATDLTLLGALGGRWDQSLANLMLLARPELAAVTARIVQAETTICIIRDRAEITGRAGDTLSLIALNGDAHGVTIEGCEYPLHQAVLPFGATLGISNVLSEPVAHIRVAAGLLLALHTARPDGKE